ncbi:MAG: TolB family protein [Pirellulales bacterium]
MPSFNHLRPVQLIAIAIAAVPLPSAQAGEPGIFERYADVGQVGLPGSADFDAARHVYRVKGGGENMWFGTDAFQFVHKQISGDFDLSSRIAWPKAGGNAHRKACLMIRQSLAPDAPYVDAVVHGDGLTSLQFRDTPGGTTHEVRANVQGPAALRLERHGEFIVMSVSGADGKFQHSGCARKLVFTDPVYVGLAVCAHDNKVIEEAEFAEVRLAPVKPPAGKPRLNSTLEIVPVGSKDRQAIYHSATHFEAPNWSPDGSHFVFNSQGSLFRLPVKGGTPERIDTGFAKRSNNDHGFSPDGKQLAISDQSLAGGKSLIYILPATGGTPRPITPTGPSYWHGWSPDGKTLAYCAERGGNFDVYTIPAAGGNERRLTTSAGLDDGPEYSPDGRKIYFNSDRTGRMQIWRMNPDGSGQEPVTSDAFNNWFAHPSPDGKWLVFLSYEKDVKDHPANKDVRLRLMPVAGGPIQELGTLFGGQGTINVPSWSPDSRNVAFVSYHFTNR